MSEAEGVSPFSNVEINGERQTWEQLFNRERERNQQLEAYRRLVSDLSRCQHGRHIGDVCSACGGPSKGNSHAVPGTVIGYDIGGRPYIVPAKAQFARIDEWLVP